MELIWIESPVKQLEEKGLNLLQIRENALLKPIISRLVYEWLPIHLKPLVDMTKLEQFNRQMQIIWDKTCDENWSLSQIESALTATDPHSPRAHQERPIPKPKMARSRTLRKRKFART